MEQKTIACPACGAPLKYSGELETMRCGYCDADLKVVRVGDEVSFQVLSQPEPQKEVLKNPVIPQGSLTVDEGAAEVYHAPASDAPSFFTEPQRSEPFTPGNPIPTPPTYSAAGDTGAQVYPPAPAARSGAPTWLWIVLGVVGVSCLLCACLAIAAVFLFNVSSGVTF